MSWHGRSSFVKRVRASERMRIKQRAHSGTVIGQFTLLQTLGKQCRIKCECGIIRLVPRAVFWEGTAECSCTQSSREQAKRDAMLKRRDHSPSDE